MNTGLTYADILLVPKKTPLASRKQAQISSRFTKNIPLNAPFISSNMVTVTEHEMAIAMARHGGLGVIHQFSSITERCDEVRKVKRSTAYIIDNPLAVHPSTTIKELKIILNQIGISSALVFDNELVGIITHKDFQFANDAQTVESLMTPKHCLIVCNEVPSIEQAKQIMHEHKIEKLPIITDSVKLITAKDVRQHEEWTYANRDEKGRLRVAAALGVKTAMDDAKQLINAGADVLVMDVAHAHSDTIINTVKQLKATYNIDIMVGNIATKQAAIDLIEAGADGLKVGIGPSPVCTTRIMSGAGIPQFTAVQQVCEVAKTYGVPVTADGGMSSPGDAVKAIAAGASSVYSGSFFAGTDEAPGRILVKDGKRYKKYMGSASYDNNHARTENMENKRIKKTLDIFVEGVAVLVDYKGPVRAVLKKLVKGLQSGISYGGAHNIEELQQNAEFIQITSAGWHESGSRGSKLSE